MNRKIISLVIIVLLSFTVLPIPVGAISSTTHSGIDLHGYHWICIESDDWGGDGSWNVANTTESNYLINTLHVYHSGFWGNMTLESVDDLNALFAVMAKHPGVPITANFCMEYMNGTAMQSNGWTHYVGVPINKTGWINETKYGASTPNYRGDLNSLYLEGYRNGYWLPEYHGNIHRDMDWILWNCSLGDPITIDCVVNHSIGPVGYPTSLTPPYYSLSPPNYPLDGDDWINNGPMTMYFGTGNKTVEQCQDNLTRGLAEFHNLFGYYPEHIVGGSLYATNNLLAALHNTTIYSISGLGHGWLPNGTDKDWGWTDMEIKDGISINERSVWQMDDRNYSYLPILMSLTNSTFAAGQVFAANMHKHNFLSELNDLETPGITAQRLHLLDDWITEVEQFYPDTWWLTAPELAQLNMHGYSIQNWSDKIVVRNALSDRNIDIPMPSGFYVNRLSITNSSSVNMTYSVLNSHTIRINVPHNETFTILKVSIFNYDAQISALVPIFVAATIVVLIMAVISKGVIGPFSRLFRRIDL